MVADIVLAAAAGAAGTLALMMSCLRWRALRRPVIRAAVGFSRSPALLSGGLMAGTCALAVGAILSSIPKTPVVTSTEFETAVGASAIRLLASAPGAEEAASRDEANSRALDSLRNFAERMEGKREMIASLGQNSVSRQGGSDLPDVETMMSKLRLRLEQEPTDVKGWMTLGWACANTGKIEEAVQAYETALKLDSSNVEAQSALDTLKATVGTARREKS